MILDALLAVLFEVVELVIGLLPDGDPNFVEGTAVRSFLGTAVGPLDSIVPASEVAATAEPTLEIILPVLIAARLAFWVYFMTPVLK